MKVIFSLVVLCSVAWSQQLPDCPKPKIFDTETSIELGILGASLSADGLSTERFMAYHNSPFNLHELNPLARPFVDRGRGGTAAFFAASYAVDLGAVYWMRKHHHTRAARLFLLGDIAYESFLTVHNYSILPGAQR